MARGPCFGALRPRHDGDKVHSVTSASDSDLACFSFAEDLGGSPSDPFQDLERLREEQHECEAALSEEDAAGEIALRDLQLEKARLAGLLRRLQARRPGPGEMCEQLLQELGTLAAEVRGLREENASLAVVRETAIGEAEQPPIPARAGDREHRPSRCSPSGRPARSATEELCEELRAPRRRRETQEQALREARLGEWQLDRGRQEAKRAAAQLRQRERLLLELRAQHARAQEVLRERTAQAARVHQEAAHERTHIQMLNREVLQLREACCLPAKLKRETSFLVKVLNQEGGRLKTQQHARALEDCRRLYDEVSARAPALLPLAGRAVADVEAAFARYTKLEAEHSKALQRLHHVVAQGLRR